MALKTLVKASSISNLSDARYCAGMGVDFLGFRVVQGQSQAISAKTYQEIRGWISGPQIVAEIYGIENSADISRIIEDFRPDYLELGLNELQKVGSVLNLPFMLALNKGEVPLAGLKPAYLILSESKLLAPFIPEHEVLITVKSREDLHQTLKQTGVSGVCLHGSQEIRPGLKNYDELADILEALDED